MDSNERKQFQSNLMDWYERHARDLPWRRAEDWYQVWISEIMLQQTRVDQAKPYFERFIRQFPDVQSLATSSLDEVLLVWEGLGYYSRARNLHRAAIQIVERFDGRFPEDPKEAISLAGVGHYTAGAVLSIAYGVAEPAVDGNVKRVLARYLAVEHPVDRTAGESTVREAARGLVDYPDPGAFNQAVMELGALVCTPKSPNCSACPLIDCCRARRNGIVDTIPVSTKKRPPPHYDVAVGILSNERGELLLTRRPEDGLLSGLWEFPGARCRLGESLPDAVRRGVTDRIGLRVEPTHEIVSIKHAFSHFKITIYAFACETAGENVVSEPAQEFRWIAMNDLSSVALHRAARRIADYVVTDESWR